MPTNDNIQIVLLKKRVGVKEVAEALGVNCDTVRRYARLGKLPGAKKVGHDWSFDPERINKMFERSR
jgi:predicted site-specific integrase-resolvase